MDPYLQYITPRNANVQQPTYKVPNITQEAQCNDKDISVPTEFLEYDLQHWSQNLPDGTALKFFKNKDDFITELYFLRQISTAATHSDIHHLPQFMCYNITKQYIKTES